MWFLSYTTENSKERSEKKPRFTKFYIQGWNLTLSIPTSTFVSSSDLSESIFTDILQLVYWIVHHAYTDI